MSTSADGDDLTGWECFVNHIHIDDFTGAVKGVDEEPSRVLLRGLKYAVELREKLKRYELDKPGFRILVGYNASDRSGTVHFHKIRPNQSWLSDNLEEHRQDAVCTFES